MHASLKVTLTLCILVDFPIHIDTMPMGLTAALCALYGVTGRIL